ncbi:MAG: amidohydrolase family protein, partial [Planctomycetota bacterium]
LPRTTMGAVLALDELMAFAGGDDSFADEYGPLTGPALAKAIAAGVAWRMGAESAGEVRAILDAAERYGFPLVVDGASDAVSAAAELAAAGVPVIARPHFEAGANRGKSATGDWPEYDTIARLVGEGVRVAISTPRGMGSSDLRFAAALAMRGGLGADRALDAITIEAARILGVDGRVGSLRPGKDADLVVMTGAPLSTGASVLATVVGGEIVWSPELARSGSDATRPGKVKRGVPKALRPEPLQPVVVSVDELHVGDGTVHRPGEVLLVGGKVAEVGARVARPAGARVVRGAAAMPGMIDAWGHLGLDGIGRAFSTRLDATRILEPGDYADRQVARRGVTTVNLASTSLGSITPTVAYKPAADSFDGLVIDGVATVFLEWNSNITTTSGDSVRQTLARARKYVDAWNEYEAAMATWTPPAPEPAATDDSDEDDDESEEEDDDDKPKKKKRKKGERDPAKPVTGVFEGTLTLAGAEPGASAENARLRFDEDADGGITGSLRTSLFEDLLAVTGSRDGYDVTLSIETPDGTWAATLAQIYSNDPKPKKKRSKKKSKKDDDEDAGDGEGDDKAKKVALVLDDDDKKKDDEDAPVETYLRGEVTLNEAVIGSFDVTQVSSEFKRIRRPRIEPEEELERKKAPKGKPKEPKRDSDLEPFRRALRGEAAVIVSVDRRDQVLACVDAFEAFGVAPILYDSDEAHTVAGQIADRVSGALMPRRTLMGSGATRLAALASAGIPVGFPSQAEEGAAELGVFAAMAVARGLSPSAALRGLTGDAAKMLRIDDRVGRLAPGLDADVIVLDGDPLEVASSVVHAFVNGREVQ